MKISYTYTPEALMVEFRSWESI